MWAYEAELLAPRSAEKGGFGDQDGDFAAFIGQALTAPLANTSAGSANAAASVSPVPPTVIASPVLNPTVTTYNVAANSVVQIAASNSARQFLLIQNQDQTNAVQVSFGSAVSPGSMQGLLIGPGASLFMDIKVACNAIFATNAAGVSASVTVAVVLG